MAKLPAFQFYPGDWRKDPGVQSLSYHDRGVWFEILCLMHESEERGKLLLNGHAMPDEALSRLLGLDKQVLTKTLTTILAFGVASRDPQTGALMSRRMVREEEIRVIKVKAGKLGGNPVLLNQNTVLLKQEVNQNPTTHLKQNGGSSSSSSTSVDNGGAKSAKPRFVKPTMEEVKAYMQEVGCSVDPQRWLDHYEANGWRVGRNPMRDWKAAVRTWKNNGYGTSKPYGTQTTLNRNAGTCNHPTGAGGARAPIQTAESLSGSLPLDDVPA